MQVCIHTGFPGQAVFVLSGHVLLEAAVGAAPRAADGAEVAGELRHVLALHVADERGLVAGGVLAVAADPHVVPLAHLGGDDGVPVRRVVRVARGVVHGEPGLEAGLQLEAGVLCVGAVVDGAKGLPLLLV